MEIADAGLIAEFVVESQEGLANVESQMLTIEAGGVDIDADLVNSVFRAMHSIKGAAGFLGLDRIGSLAHSLEEVLNNLRNREIVPTSELVTTVLRAADFMKRLIDEVDKSNEADVSPYVAELQRFRPGATAGAVAPAQPTLKTESVAEKSIISSVGPAATLREAAREFLIECHENLDQMDGDLLKLEHDPSSEQLLRNIFRTIHTIKGGAGFLGLGELEKLTHAAEDLLGKLRNGERTLTPVIGSALLATVDKCREGLAMVEASGNTAALDPAEVIEQLHSADCDAPAVLESELPADCTVALDSPTSNTAPTPDVAETLASTSAVRPAAGSSPADAVHADKSNASVSDSTIRVDVELLDKLMTRVGELVLARNQILQHTTKLDDSNFVSTAQRLNLITTELQESVMKTRMQPIGNVWAKFPRVVRDLSSQLGKQVRIEMEGKETELDKTIIESIKDPLTHLVRNSVDHGVESAEVRRAAGKPAEGCLILRAYHEGGQVNIEISDDGAGLNLERIRKKAVERGLVAADAASRMSERELAQLILLPGFSTAEKVTAVSGRGVGMDVVKTNIEKIGGTLDLQSHPGVGTTVRIKIPLTLAIIPALVVKCGGDRYAIPQVSLLELVRLEEAEGEKGIEFVHGAPVYRLRGKLLPLVYLSERLGQDAEATDVGEKSGRITNIVVLRANDRQFGLVVDKILDTEEIVVKPLSRQLKGLREYAGATIMGDGTVALILDVMGLALASGVVDALREQTVAQSLADELRSAAQLETLLVVDLGDARRFAMPTSLVARLERVARSAVEYVDGREVIQYRGAILPLVKLSDVFGESAESTGVANEFQIVVYADDDRQCGLVVNRIVDIVATELHFESEKGPDDYLLGTAIVQQRATNLLNLQRLARYEGRCGSSHAMAS